MKKIPLWIVLILFFVGLLLGFTFGVSQGMYTCSELWLEKGVPNANYSSGTKTEL